MGVKPLFAFLSTSLLWLSLFAAHAATDFVELKNNPFSQPEIKVQAVRNSVPPAQVTRRTPIELEATLVSVNGSMVIANGELIAIGENIEGMKLIKVREGEAVFGKGQITKTYKVGVAADD